MKPIRTLALLFISLHVLTSNSHAQTAAKTTVISSRLRADVNITFVSGAYVGQDSTTFDYAPPRGAWPGGWEDWKYSSKNVYSFGISSYDLHPSVRYVLSFNSVDQVTDRVTQQWSASTSSWENSKKEVLSYSSYGTLDTVTGFEWEGLAGTWKANPVYRETYQYNALYQRTQKLYQTWSPSYSSLRNLDLYSYNWLGSGNMESSIHQVWNVSSWKNYDKDVYSWDISNNNTETQRLVWNGYVWDSSARDTHSDFHNHQPGVTVREFYYTWAGMPGYWGNAYRWHTTYNISNNPTYSYLEAWSMAIASWEPYTGPSSARRWYYEDYDPTAPIGVKELSGNEADITLYPVPASKELNIRLKWQDEQAFSATVYDAHGRQVSVWQQPASREYTDKLDVSILPAGIYYLVIIGSNGIIKREFNVLHQTL